MLNLCITFDYELWLDRIETGDYELLFEPTEKILEMLRQEGVKTTFFADVCSVMRHNDYGLKDYCERFSSQLQKAARDGHDVQLHIHPSWKNCVYENGHWDMSYSGYCIQSYGFEPDKADSGYNIIRSGIEYLNNIIRPINSDYKCIAYRAGGFCVKPEEELMTALYENGIRIDSSVAIGQKASEGEQIYDFSQYAYELDWYYRAGDKIESVAENKAGERVMQEIAIGYAKNNPFKFAGIPASKLHVNGAPRTVISIGNNGFGEGLRESIYGIIRKAAGTGILSLDTRGYRVLERDIRELYKTYRCDRKEHTVAIICHPKMATDDTVENMRRFIRFVKSADSLYSFMTMRDYYEKNF